MPDIKFAAADVSAMKLGTTNISKVMLGTTEVWPGAPTVLPYGLHLDATDATKFTYTATPPQVATWTDKSAAALVFTTGTPGTAVIRNGTINGVTAVNFNGLTQQMSYLNIDTRAFVDAVNFTDCMAFIVVEFTDTTRQELYLHGSAGSPRIYFDLRSTARIDIGNDTTARLTGAVTNATATPYLYAIYRNGATMKLFRNGTELLSRTNASGAMSSLPTADITLASTAFRADLGELIIVPGYDAAQFASIRTSLGTKWGIATP